MAVATSRKTFEYDATTRSREQAQRTDNLRGFHVNQALPLQQTHILPSPSCLHKWSVETSAEIRKETAVAARRLPRQERPQVLPSRFDGRHQGWLG